MNIIQVGVNVGSDHLTSLICGKDVSKLILVEPFSLHNESIINCYGKFKNYYIENIAISPIEEQTEIQFYYHVNDYPLFEVASIDKNHILKHGQARYGILDEAGLRTLQVKCSTLNNLFDKYNLIDIDILYVDAEGFDDVIIESINYNKYNISKIYFEHIHIDFNKLCKFLSTQGYNIDYNVTTYTSLATKQY